MPMSLANFPNIWQFMTPKLAELVNFEVTAQMRLLRLLLFSITHFNNFPNHIGA